MLFRRRIPPFFRMMIVILFAFGLWSIKHPKSRLKRKARSVQMGFDMRPKFFASLKTKRSTSKFHKVSEVCTNTVTNVVFLKTHKTGSSTMSNIMLRFADTHNLTVGLPLKNHWELGGYPAFIDKRLIDPPLNKYNILGHHFRFNIDNVQEIMPDSTRYITIVRAPKDNVESVFGFFQDQSPFNDWLKDVDANTTALRLQTFYDQPEKFFDKKTDWFFRAKNYMFFDIGYDVSNADEEYIDEKIEEMDNIFTFVLLTDFFDESLVLMKHKLCWDWDDILYIKFKMRTQEAKTDVNPELGRKIIRWNHADSKLYDHFNRTFWRTVNDYGRERMRRDLDIFEKKLKEAESQCIDSYQPLRKKPWLVGARLKRKPSEFCKQLTWSETVYGEKLREKMYRTIPGIHQPSSDDDAIKNELFNEIAKGALQ